MNGLRQKAIARRYARALLNVAMAEGADVDRIDRELTSAVNLTGQHPLLNRVLVSPVVSRDRKRAILDAISVRAGWSDLLRRFLGLLADRHRLGVLPEIIDCLRSELLARRGIVRAHVTTAMPLDAAQIEAIAKALSAVTRRDVELDARVDPSLIGGAVARVGSTIYDGSIAGQLARMRAWLTAAPRA